MLTQIKELKSFLSQAATLSGKGPSPMTHDRADRNTQIQATKEYVAKFANKHARQEASEENNNPRDLCQAVVWGTCPPRGRAWKGHL